MPRPTVTDIARELGCSKNTISLALRGDGQIPERTQERVRAMAEQMGYVPNATVSHLMAQLRSSRSTRFRAKLAMINTNRDEQALRRPPTIPTYVHGCKSRAKKTGYSFDEFWLHDPEYNAARLRRIFTTRGIKGIVLSGLMDSNRLPQELAPLWK